MADEQPASARFDIKEGKLILSEVRMHSPMSIAVGDGRQPEGDDNTPSPFNIGVRFLSSDLMVQFHLTPKQAKGLCLQLCSVFLNGERCRLH